MTGVEQNKSQIEGTVSQGYLCLREVHSHCGVVSDALKSYSLKGGNHEQVRFDSPNFQKHIHNSFLATIYANRFGVCAVEYPEIDLRQGDVGSGRDLVDETLQRSLVDDDLFHCYK